MFRVTREKRPPYLGATSIKFRVTRVTRPPYSDTKSIKFKASRVTRVTRFPYLGAENQPNLG